MAGVSSADERVAPWLKRWGLAPDGAAFTSRSGALTPVRHAGAPAMLKVSAETEERFGAAVMAWWDGDGAARVFAHEGDAVLMERAEGARSLKTMALGGRDDEASRILCAVADRLHAPREDRLPDLVPLDLWFRALFPIAAAHGGTLARCAEAATALLADAQDVTPLHGDLHHDNVLDFGEAGWRAIDPKGLIGERGFDHANIFCNPEETGPVANRLALAPGRLGRQAHVVAEAAGLDRRRLLQWISAYAGLSAAWHIGDGDRAAAALPLGVAELADAELARG